MSDLKAPVLTKEDCETILRNYEHEKHELTSYTIEPLSDTIEGLVGEHFIANIVFQTGATGRSQEQRFFVKTLNGKSQILFELAQTLNAYQKEEFFYDYLIGELRSVNIDTSFAPMNYLCRPYKIVLEDLRVRGLANRGKKEFFDVQHCRAALATIARLHAAAIIYERNKSINLHEKFGTQLAEKMFAGDDNAAAKWLKCSVHGFVQLIAHLDIPEQSRSEFVNKLMRLHEDLPEIIKPRSDHFSTILHGDLWSNNFLFKYQDGKITDTVLIDYQMLKYGHPAIDAVQMLLTNTRKDFRNQHYDSLLNYYYKTLMELLGNIDAGMSNDDFFAYCANVKAAVKLQATADRSITFLAEETYVHALQDDELFIKFLYEDRGKYMVESFLKYHTFKEIINEDLLELFDLLTK